MFPALQKVRRFFFIQMHFILFVLSFIIGTLMTISRIFFGIPTLLPTFRFAMFNMKSLFFYVILFYFEIKKKYKQEIQ